MQYHKKTSSYYLTALPYGRNTFELDGWHRSRVCLFDFGGYFGHVLWHRTAYSKRGKFLWKTVPYASFFRHAGSRQFWFPIRGMHRNWWRDMGLRILYANRSTIINQSDASSFYRRLDKTLSFRSCIKWDLLWRPQNDYWWLNENCEFY